MSLALKLENREPLYMLPQDDVIREVLNPALTAAENFYLMSGFFSLGLFRDLAHGLAKYIALGEGKLRILVSPELSIPDQEALREGLSPDTVISRLVQDAFESDEALESALVQHSRECLAYLLAHDRLEIRVVLMRKGLFHPKIWIFENGTETAVLSGSANATQNGLGLNVEQLDLNCSWLAASEAKRCRLHKSFFERYWSPQGTSETRTLQISDAILRGVLKSSDDSKAPTEKDYEKAIAAEFENYVEQQSAAELWQAPFQIPADLEWETGLYRHQGDAVKAWENNGSRGTLEMATGAGKTLTSLIAAQRLYERVGKLFVLVAVPTKILLEQWEKDLLAFGLKPYLGLGGTQNQHLEILELLLESIETGLSDIESAIVTHDFMKNPQMRELLERHESNILFIADEVHNLGTTSFLGNAPNTEFRLALSATLERQYDPEGSQGLVDYFGEVVFSFTLDEAIGLCLVPYDYQIHEVSLTEDEMEEYLTRTREIGRLLASSQGNPTGASLQRLNVLYKLRRRILESAEHKLHALEQALRAIPDDELSHTLIYCTASNPKQLDAVNEILNRLDIRFYQVTQLESGGRLVSSILSQFRRGGLRVLTAKKVLDEGFNVPEIKRAFLLASSSVKREWTQRRGRVLRLSPGKDFAEIIDFVALPMEGYLDREAASRFMKPELTRVEEFLRLSRNKNKPGGPTERLIALQLEYDVSLDDTIEIGDDGLSADADLIDETKGE